MKVTAVPHYVRSYISAQPSYMILYVTSRCNQKCEFCFYADSLNKPWRDGLTFEELSRVADSLHSCIHMTMTGGEPFLRKDLAQIITVFYEKSGLRNLTLPSNGSMTDLVVTTLKEVCTRHKDLDVRLALSIDALGERHDQIRGLKNAFTKAKATFDQVKELQKQFKNLHLIVNTVASKYNKDHLYEFLDYASEHLVADDHSLLLARGNTKQPDAKDVTKQEFDQFVRYLENKRKSRSLGASAHSKLLQFVETETRHIANKTYKENKYQIPCVAGGKFIVMYETGEVYPCEIIETLEIPSEVKNKYGGSFRLGNIRDTDYDLPALLSQERAQEIRQYIKDSKCFCTFECAIAASIVFNPKTLIKTAIQPPSREIEL